MHKKQNTKAHLVKKKSFEVRAVGVEFQARVKR